MTFAITKNHLSKHKSFYISVKNEVMSIYYNSAMSVILVVKPGCFRCIDQLFVWGFGVQTAG